LPSNIPIKILYAFLTTPISIPFLYYLNIWWKSKLWVSSICCSYFTLFLHTLLSYL
jgi:hypothetical protein